MINEIRDNNLNTVEFITYIHDSGENNKKIDTRVDRYGDTYKYTYDNANMKNRITNRKGIEQTLWYDSNYFVTNLKTAEAKTVDVNYNTNSMEEELHLINLISIILKL